MAVSYTWPATLPQFVTRDFGDDGGVLMARTPMDKGPAKLRYLGARPDTLSVGFQMTTAQFAIFEAFVKTTLRGTARFGFPHPRTASQIEARIVPDGEGRLYSDTYLSPNSWRVSMTIEVLP